MLSVHNLKQLYRTPIKSDNFFVDIFNRKYKEHEALKGISFTIEQGSLVGFIGPNGAGKTTTMKILTGILFPTSGDVNVLGFKPFEKKHEYLKQISFVMGQKNQLIWELPATDSFRVTKEIYEIPDKEYKRNVHQLMELLDVSDVITQPVKTLSLGQRMKIELINALLHKPKILFLDEPTIGLDIFAQTTIIQFIKDYQKNTNATVILTSHYMQDVERLAKRVLLIDHGHIIVDQPLKELVHTYSADKRIVFTLNTHLSPLPDIVKKFHHSFIFPQLTVSIPKKELSDMLPALMKCIPFQDITIEYESIEAIIKKVFTKEPISI